MYGKGDIIQNSCPDILSERSDFVKASFDPTKLVGLWYEHNYIDIAQVGATCQTLSGNFETSSEILTLNFSVLYNGIPFKIDELYYPASNKSDAFRGYYIKRVDAPGSKLLELPTVIVDVTLSSDGSRYTTLTMVSCVVKLELIISELLFVTRLKMEDPAVLQSMQETARELGVVWDPSQLKTVNWTLPACTNSSMDE